jgi:hypothetical protein
LELSYTIKFYCKTYTVQDLIALGIKTNILSIEETPGEWLEIEFETQPTPQDEQILDNLFSQFTGKQKRTLTSQKLKPKTVTINNH